MRGVARKVRSLRSDPIEGPNGEKGIKEDDEHQSRGILSGSSSTSRSRPLPMWSVL